MSTSPSLAPDRSVPQPPEFHPFPYAALSEAEARSSRRAGITAASGPDAADLAARDTLARSQGQREGYAQAEKSFVERLTRERASMASALSQFTRDRATFFQKVEGEVVQLALSIARKILHREAQVDPLLLVGIVRVALEQIEGATGVVLRVHPENIADWRRSLALQLDPADLPEITEDPSLAPDTCVLETAMGSTVLGLEVQLKEIERGLMDLLAARPGGGS